MDNYKELPTGYQQLEQIDLQKDKKLAILVNVIAVIIMAVFFLIGHAIVPFGNFYRTSGLLPMLVLIAGSIAYAGSNCYFNKKHYIIIALAPIVIWGIVLLVLNLVFKETWFWVIYFIQIFNLSGAAGDLYVTYRFSKLPKDILIKDIGVNMTIYTNDA